MSDETPDERRARLGLEATAKGIGQIIAGAVRDAAGPSVGFLFVMFDFGDRGSMSYMSNGQREDILKMLEELRGKLADRPRDP